MRNVLIVAAAACVLLTAWIGGQGLSILLDYPETGRAIVGAVYIAGGIVALVGAVGAIAAVALLDAVRENTEATKPPPRMLT